MSADEQLRAALGKYMRRAVLTNAGVADEQPAVWGKWNGSSYDTAVSYSPGFYWVTVSTANGISHSQVTNPLGFALSGGDKIFIARSTNMGRWIVTKRRAAEGP